MSVTSATPAADRLLTVAGNLFRRDGIRAVGINRILAEADVSKATLYHAFGSKEALVVAYLEEQDAKDRRRYRATAAQLESGMPRVLLSFELAERAAIIHEFRGCLYVNALAEYPEPGHPVARAVAAHRAWLRSEWSQALAPGGAPALLDEALDLIQLLYDGAQATSRAERSPAPFAKARAALTQFLQASGW